MKHLILITTLLFNTGCVDCMIKGLGAYECGRTKDNAKAIEAHDKIIAQYNIDLELNNAGLILAPAEKQDIVRAVCAKNADRPFQNLPLTDHRMLLGIYYEKNFCRIYQNDNSLRIYRRELRNSDESGRMQFLLSDGIKALEYVIWPVIYTENGYRFGVY